MWLLCDYFGEYFLSLINLNMQIFYMYYKMLLVPIVHNEKNRVAKNSVIGFSFFPLPYKMTKKSGI